MANVGRISGPLLKANLVRNGIDIAVETDLLYVDVNNLRIGVNNAAPAYDLDITGTTQTTSLLSGQATVDNVDIDGNDITVLSGNLRLTGFDASAGVEANDLFLTQNQLTTVASGDNILIDTNTTSSVIINSRLTINDAANVDTKMSYGSLSFNGETSEALIETTTTDLDLQLSSNGLGIVVTNSNTQVGSGPGDPKDLTVTGNTFLNGNLTIDGNITIGDADTDGITIGADFESNLVPNAASTYDLGTLTKYWRDAFIGDLQLTTNSLTTTVTNSDIRITPDGTGNAVIDTTKALVLPIGTSAERPADTTGAIRWNTTNENYEAFDARTGINEWATIPLGQAVTRYQFTETGGQTEYTGADDNGNTFATVPGGTEIVIQNGQVLEEVEEYTTTDTTLTLVTGATLDDDVNIISIGTFKVGDVVLKSTGGTFDSGVIVDGNFSVFNNTILDGSLNVVDRIVSIGTGASGTLPASDDDQDRGINFKWHDGVSGKNGFFGFDDSTGYFTFIPDATITGEVVSGTQGDVQATNFRGDVIAADVSTGTLTATGVVSFDTTEAIKIPVGTTAERPASLATGQIRYNSDLTIFEGYNGTGWELLGGVTDTDGNTYIQAETSLGANNNELEFFVSGTREMLIDSTGVSLTQALPTTSGGTGLATYTQGDIVYSDAADSLASLAIGATNTVLVSNGSAPAWSTSLNLAGTLDVTGAVGLSGAITQTDTTASTDVNTGAIVTDGGVGIAGALNVGGNATITGDLTVDGNTNINSASLTTTSNTLILADGSADAVAADGAGVVVDLGTDGTADITYDQATDSWTINKNVTATTFTGNLIGNADTATAWATARTISVSGAVTGSVSVDGTGNVDIATTATSDPTLTLDGDATGTATFTDLGNATLTVTVDGGNAQTLDSLDSTDFTLDLVTGNGNTTTNAITAGDITATGTFFGNVQGNVTGTLDGEVTGSVFGDDSTLLVDGINNTIPGYVSLATLQAEVAASTDFTDFQARIAAL
jgi:hypothetical protein